ncbi:hypothetical protein [Protaetiibacter larvae]|uniref:Uncharacterized protein n=1 Tax=Protaetiibacter larvae TaxID=2592654 RepID=A0A5C1YC83_9MICO|nr:hypothetical protein [Protaetiibacter larvae]QEO10497.1 hypothetical protein FLP23_11080 [Protaetiibacter larvae]
MSPLPTSRRPIIRRAGAALLVVALGTTLAACGLAQQESPPELDPTVSQEPRDLPSASPSASPSEDPAADSLTDDDITNIEEAISSGNTAAIEGYLADPTRVLIAASEADDLFSPVDAVLSLDYVQPGLGTWDFALPPDTVDRYRTSQYYGEFFPDDVIVGRSDDNAIVAFSPEGGTIDTIFMSANEEFLFY